MGIEIKKGDSEAKQARKKNRKAKRIRKGEEKADRKKYGKGEEGRKNKMEAIAKQAAARKMDRAEERISSQTAPTDDGTSMSCGKPMGASKPNPNAKKERKKKRAVKKTMKTIGKKGVKDKKRPNDPTSPETERKDLLKYSPVADRERDAMRKMGGSMYGKKHGSSISGEKYDAKEAYNKNLSASSRLHYLENERHDKTGGHSIHKHMKGFGGSMKLKGGYGASLPGTPAGSKSKRMTNLGTKAMNSKKPQYTDSGQNYKDANNRLVSGSQVDEGELSSVIRKSPMRPYVKGGKDSMYAGEKLFLTKDKGSMMRTMEPLKKMKTGRPTKNSNPKLQGKPKYRKNK